jgi:hypothetical protein
MQASLDSVHLTPQQSMRLTDHVTLNFNNVSKAVVLFDLEKAFDTMWHAGNHSCPNLPHNDIRHTSVYMQRLVDRISVVIKKRRLLQRISMVMHEKTTVDRNCIFH